MSARLLLADDHALVRRGVRLILEQEPDLAVAAEASDGAEAVELARTVPDLNLVVLDIAMPRMTGLQAAPEIGRRAAPLPVLMLSMHDDEQYFFGSLEVGASGYVLKSVVDEDLVGACRAALRGEAFVHPGASSKEIAQALTISIKTVERHRANILAKLGMRHRTQLTRYAIRAGLIEP